MNYEIESYANLFLLICTSKVVIPNLMQIEKIANVCKLVENYANVCIEALQNSPSKFTKCELNCSACRP